MIGAGAKPIPGRAEADRRARANAAASRLAWAFALLGALLVGLAGCARGCEDGADAPDLAQGPTFPAPDLRLALLTDPMGQLEPCGCTSRPLGGLDLLAGALREARGAAPTLAFAAGHVHFEGASIPEAALVQEQLEAETTERALAAAGLDGAFVARPRSAAEEKFLARPPRIPRLRDGEPRVFSVGERRVLVLGVETATSEEVGRALAAAPARDVTLILHVGSRRRAAEIASLPGVDFVLLAGLDEETVSAPRPRGGAHILTAGRQGQRLLLLDLYLGPGERFADHSPLTAEERRAELARSAAELEEKLRGWEREGTFHEADLEAQRARLRALREQASSLRVEPDVRGARAFVARIVEIDPDVARASEIAEMMLAHDKRVNAHNREAFRDMLPLPVPEGEPAYVGSGTCASCHAAAHDWWTKTPHGRAYQTLVDRHKEFSLSCVGCHVTGYGQPGGATVTWNLDRALVNVGCEQCHGPGGEHVDAPLDRKRETILRETPERVCVGCHNEEHSDRFGYEAYRARLIAPGHGK